jgi:hypothetical protein
MHVEGSGASPMRYTSRSASDEALDLRGVQESGVEGYLFDECPQRHIDRKTSCRESPCSGDASSPAWSQGWEWPASLERCHTDPTEGDPP